MSEAVYFVEKRFGSVENRCGAYRTRYESGYEGEREDLMQQTAAAVICFDFADLVMEGNNLYESINSLDNDWRKLVFEVSTLYSISFENRISGLFKRWLEVSKKTVAFFTRIENDFTTRGIDTEPIHTMRDSIRAVENMLIDDSDFFCSQKLVELRDRAIDDHHSEQDEDFVGMGSQ